MKNKLVAIDKAVHLEFKKHCDEEGLKMGKVLENLIKIHILKNK